MKFYPHATDQIAHFTVALAVLALFASGGVIGGALAGCALGLIRELTEAGGSRITWAEVPPHFAKRDPWIDLIFWTLGGIIAALIFN